MGLRPFLKTRFRAVPGQPDEGDHWLGGEPYHRGAACPVCKVPLLLLWDINCRDPRFPRNKFGPLRRLPLYFCWGCGADLAYQVTPKGRVKLLRTERWQKGPHFPYEPYPAHFARRPLALVTGIPDEVRSILLAWDIPKDPFGARVGKRKQKLLAEYFGHPVTAALCLFHSQLGGVPSQAWWDDEPVRCPNQECPGRTPGAPPERQGRVMSFLAGVVNDPPGGLPMVDPVGEETERWWNFFISVRFLICGKCWTVHACNRCD